MPSTKQKPPSAYLASVDAYIQKAAPFAQPVLEAIRAAVHEAVPEVVEEIKWSMPFFVYHGIILANMAAFKQHCSFGVWKENVLPLMKQGVERRGTGMGSFGKLTSVKELPTARELKRLLQQSAAKIDSGERTKNRERPKEVKAIKPPAEVPAALAVALKKNKAAAQNFEQLSPSCRREYIEWIAEAKRDETRDKRVATTAEWVAQGKSRHWKYEKRV